MHFDEGAETIGAALADLSMRSRRLCGQLLLREGGLWATLGYALVTEPDTVGYLRTKLFLRQAVELGHRDAVLARLKGRHDEPWQTIRQVVAEVERAA